MVIVPLFYFTISCVFISNTIQYIDTKPVICQSLKCTKNKIFSQSCHRLFVNTAQTEKDGQPKKMTVRPFLLFPLFFNFAKCRNSCHRQLRCHHRAGKQTLADTILNMLCFISQLMLTGKFQGAFPLRQVENRPSGFPIFRNFHPAPATENPGGVIQNCPGAVFRGEQHPTFRFSGENVLPFYPGIQKTPLPPDLGNFPEQPMDKLHRIDAAGQQRAAPDFSSNIQLL